MSIRLMLFFMMSFFLLSGCLYSCNYQPEDQKGSGGGDGNDGGFIENPDPCNDSKLSQLMRFVDVSQSGQRLKVALIMKLPCKSGNGGQLFSLAFYNTQKVVEPTDLYNLKLGFGKAKSAKCNLAENSKNTEIIKQNSDYYALSQGSGLTLLVGEKTPNHLYPLYVKTSIHSSKPIGTETSDGNCIDGVDFSPFNVNSNTTAIYQNNIPILSVEREVPGLINVGKAPNKLVTMYAPFYTYGTNFDPNSKGIVPVDLSSPTYSRALQTLSIEKAASIDGSLFEFEVDMKPGSYYVVFSQVGNPAGAILGDFSLTAVKVYNRYLPNQMRDYKTECGNTVTCGSPVTVR